MLLRKTHLNRFQTPVYQQYLECGKYHEINMFVFISLENWMCLFFFLYIYIWWLTGFYKKPYQLKNNYQLNIHWQISYNHVILFNELCANIYEYFNNTLHIQVLFVLFFLSWRFWENKSPTYLRTLTWRWRVGSRRRNLKKIKNIFLKSQLYIWSLHGYFTMRFIKVHTIKAFTMFDDNKPVPVY